VRDEALLENLVNIDGSTGKNLLLLEEIGRALGENVEIDLDVEDLGVAQKFTQVVERKNFTENTPFLVEDEDVQMPVEGAGRVKQLMVLARKKNFAVTIETDRKPAVDTTFTELQELSTELSDVAAYVKNGKYLVAASGYPFRKNLKISVRPEEETYFDTVRLNLVRKETPETGTSIAI